MITSLQLKDFKNFADETLCVGPFTVIVGTNASGKSNIRDAFRFLHGIGRGYTLAEIIGGKYLGGQPEWEAIRGAPREVARFGNLVFGLETTLMLEGQEVVHFIVFRPEVLGGGGFRIGHEHLLANNKTLYAVTYGSPEMSFEGISDNFADLLRRDQPNLTQLREFPSSTRIGEHIVSVVNTFVNVRFSRSGAGPHETTVNSWANRLGR